MIYYMYRGGRVSVLPEIKQLNTMEQDDIERFDDGAMYPELTKEEQEALEDKEFPHEPVIGRPMTIMERMDEIIKECEKLKELLSK